MSAKYLGVGAADSEGGVSPSTRQATKARSTPKQNHKSSPLQFTKTRSFLRWVGGKRHLIPQLEYFLPANIRKLTYIEPFAGAANFFFALQPGEAQLSDLNSHLIACYNAVASDHSRIASYLRRHGDSDTEAYYYEIREQYNRSRQSSAQAARFIYLNRTCFNGIFRVNVKGAFNVPYGHKATPIIPDAAELENASSILNRATIKTMDFEVALKTVTKGCFAYIDPPYPPLNGTSFFQHYTADRFKDENQERLAEALHGVHRRGGKFLLSNADLPSIRALYDSYHITPLSVRRYVSSNGSRAQVGELIITNYRQ